MLWAVCVLNQHPMLSVNRQELRARQTNHQLLVFLTADQIREFLLTTIDNFSTLHHQPINGVHHSNRIAWNRISREHHRIPRADFEVGMFTLEIRVIADINSLENQSSESELSHRAAGGCKG